MRHQLNALANVLRRSVEIATGSGHSRAYGSRHGRLPLFTEILVIGSTEMLVLVRARALGTVSPDLLFSKKHFHCCDKDPQQGVTFLQDSSRVLIRFPLLVRVLAKRMSTNVMPYLMIKRFLDLK